MDPSSDVAALQQHIIASIAGSVSVALIVSFFELFEFFVLSSSMLFMLSVQPTLQWIICDEPPLKKRDEILAYVIPFLCFTTTYVLPELVAITICRSASFVAYVWGIFIWHLSVLWIFYLGVVLTLHFNPELGRMAYRTSVVFLGDVLGVAFTGFTKFWEIAVNQCNKAVSAQKKLADARKPKVVFTYQVINEPRNDESVIAKAMQEPQIRLLKISRRNLISEITCRLEVFPLHKTPIYEAISYRWDDGKDRKDIIVNRHCLSLSLRAYNVLKGLRSLFRSRWVWIDAICIGQSSKKDKTEQVRLMGDIYQNASRTIVWIESTGLSRYEIRTTLNLLNMISFAKMGVSMSFKRLREDFMKNRPGVGSDRWRVLNNLLRHEWFGRVWMVQEVVVAKKVHAVYGGLTWTGMSFQTQCRL